MASFSAEEQKASEALKQYSAAFSNAINSIFKKIDRTVTGEEYDGVLKAETCANFPASQKPLYHITHWILYDNRMLTFRVAPPRKEGNRIRLNYFYGPEDIEKRVVKDMKKYLVTAVARAEGPEPAEEIDKCLKAMSSQRQKRIAEIISSNGLDPKLNLPHTEDGVLKEMAARRISIDPFEPAESQVACILKELIAQKPY